MKQARDSILDVILDSLFSILDLRRNRENRVENRDSQRTVNLLLNGTVHIISHKDIAEVGWEVAMGFSSHSHNASGRLLTKNKLKSISH